MFRNITLGVAILLGVGAGFSPAQPSMRGRPQPSRPQPSFTRDERLVIDWMQLYLRRNPTQRELLTFVNQLRSGMDPNAVQANIVASNEYIRRSGNSPNTWAISMVADTLGRQPTPYERALVVDLVYNYGYYQAALTTLLSRTGPAYPGGIWFWWF